ncbi:PIN domain-containing protein [Candidatus Woesearchaeota archaeon]|nr:PIN domain-containing protein [Candidatus Woesearchaeota archaeon]MBI2575372.1 PIN domain-containing protein [Candidatus Woesearchaeota archaeon]
MNSTEPHSTEFLDSNIIVYAFTSNPRKDKCRNVLRERRFLTNSLAISEAIGTIGTIDKEQGKIALISILRSGNIQIIDLSTNLLFESVRRQHKYNLKLFDLIHYTTALLNNCQSIISYDKDFDKLEIPRVEP